VVDNAVGFVDVMDGAIAETADGWIVFFASDVIMRFAEQFHGALKAAGAVHVHIDGRMIVQILAVVDGGAFDFLNGFVDLFDGVLLFFVHVISGGRALKVSASVPQIGEGVQISGMASWFVSEAKGGAEGDKKRNGGAMS
jgi:hypothetical protein